MLEPFRTRPAHWRGCLISILRPAHADEGELLIGALDDPDEFVVDEALTRTYFFCGVNCSTKKGAYEDKRIRVETFCRRVRQDRDVMRRIQQLSQTNEFFSAYWRVLVEMANV